jgi:hypothetical protein
VFLNPKPPVNVVVRHGFEFPAWSRAFVFVFPDGFHRIPELT